MDGLVARGVTEVVRSDAFTDVWAATLRGAHQALTTTATSDGGGIVVQTSEGLGIQLGEIVSRVQTRLVDQGVGIAGLIPAVDRVVIIGTGENVALVRTVCALAGVVIAIAGWVSGGSTAANRTRTFTDGVNASARRHLAALGLNTGRFGEWLGRSRALVRGLVIALAIVWLLALRPLTPGLVRVVVIVALVVGWLLELAQRRPDELAIASNDAPEVPDADEGDLIDAGGGEATR